MKWATIDVPFLLWFCQIFRTTHRQWPTTNDPRARACVGKSADVKIHRFFSWQIRWSEDTAEHWCEHDYLGWQDFIANPFRSRVEVEYESKARCPWSPRCFRRDWNWCDDGKCTSICQSLNKRSAWGCPKTTGIRRIEQRNLLIWCYENMRNKARVGIQEIGWKNQAVARLFFCWYRRRSIVKLFALFASLDNRKHRELSVKRWTS